MLFLLDALSGLFLVMTAVPAAALSLGAAFLLARARGAGRNGYLVAGAAAGLVHSVFAYWIIHLNALGHAPRYVTNGDIYYGFALMLGAATRFEAVVVTLAVMLAGAISGLVFSLCCRGFQKTRSSPQPI
jgi:hypothetical protein